jgi:hypothetical protein
MKQGNFGRVGRGFVKHAVRKMVEQAAFELEVYNEIDMRLFADGSKNPRIGEMV